MDLTAIISSLITGLLGLAVGIRKFKKDEFAELYDRQMELLRKFESELDAQKQENERLNKKIDDLRITVYKLTDGLTGMNTFPLPAWIKKIDLNTKESSLVYVNPGYHKYFHFKEQTPISMDKMDLLEKIKKSYNKVDDEVISTRKYQVNKIQGFTKEETIEDIVVVKWPILINSSHAFIGGIAIPCKEVEIN